MGLVFSSFAAEPHESKRKKGLLPLRLFLFLAFTLMLCGCGKKEEQPAPITNYTLPDVSAFNEAYNAEAAAQQAVAAAAATQSYRWKPHGVFTYTIGGDDEMWSAGYVNISSVDFDTHTALLSYSIKDQRGLTLAKSEGKSPQEKNYFFDSGGEIATGVDETEAEDGTRKIVIYLPDDHWLEFKGKEKMTSAQYHYGGLYYGLKHEG